MLQLIRTYIAVKIEEKQREEEEENLLRST